MSVKDKIQAFEEKADELKEKAGKVIDRAEDAVQPVADELLGKTDAGDALADIAGAAKDSRELSKKTDDIFER